MNKRNPFIHPYIPNSVPEVKEEMMKEIGIEDVEELYQEIPERLRYRERLDLPEPLLSEFELKKHVDAILKKNSTCSDNISFLGGGCYNHYVPAICDEINSRSEFLTGYAGEPYEDHGRFHALFEYASMMGELLDMDVVNVPTYDWGQAASTSLRMSERLTGRTKVLIASTINPDRKAVIMNYCRGVVDIEFVEFVRESGKLDIEDLRGKISDRIAAVYIENPSYFGIIDDQGADIAAIAHENGAQFVVGTDPVSLGILKPPSQYGANIVCGDIQSLGIHMQYGGSLAGFIAVHDEEKYVMEYPSRLFGITHTAVKGEWGFGDVTYDRTSFGSREQGKEFIGTATALWGITAGVYLAVLGASGLEQVGKTIMQKSLYLEKLLNGIPGVSVKFPGTANFREFVVDITDTGKDVEEINKQLLGQNIFGGIDLSGSFDGLGQCALYCVTEVLTLDDMHSFAEALKKIVI